MRASAHRVTGLCAGVIVWAILPATAFAIFAIPAGLAGGNAPDRLEWLWNFRWIPHRTVTHWLALWIAIFTVGLLHRAAPWGPAVIGYGVGGLSHLLFDWPNPAGIPILTPFDRHSLGHWKSGEHDLQLVGIPLLFAIVAAAWRLHI